MAYIEIKDATKWYPHKSGKLRDIFRKGQVLCKGSGWSKPIHGPG